MHSKAVCEDRLATEAVWVSGGGRGVPILEELLMEAVANPKDCHLLVRLFGSNTVLAFGMKQGAI